MTELIEEHKFARTTTRSLVDAKDRYRSGGRAAINDIISLLRLLADFYPKHIEKEDKHFFLPILAYFSNEEHDAMLQEFYEFDRKMIHETYNQVAIRLEHWP